jgi:hypothetical protein
MFAIKQTQKIRKNNMFIQKLKKLENTDLASALVKRQVANLQSRIYTYTNPIALKKLATNIYKVSQQHPLAKPLAKVAQQATNYACQLESKLDVIAKQVIKNGTEINGRSGRFTQMLNRHGNANALVRTVESAVGAKNFYKLVDKHSVQYTAEFFVAKYMPFAVSKDLLNEIHQLLSTIEQPTLLKQVA